MRPQPQTVTFTGPGPYELPKCGRASVIVGKVDHFVLDLVTTELNQQLFVPISVQALDELKAMVDHMVKNMGVGQTKN